MHHSKTGMDEYTDNYSTDGKQVKLSVTITL